MHKINPNDLYRCALCHRSVDADTRSRARRAWQPLIICVRCVLDAVEPAPRLASAGSPA
jgi:hypothetical protein